MTLTNEQKTILLKKALQRSPVTVAVWAWQQNEKGEYIKLGSPNHYVVLVAYDEFDRPIIWDSYESGIKILEKDYELEFPQIYILKKKEKIEEYENRDWWFVQILKRVFNLIPPIFHYLKDWLDGKPLGGLRSPKWNEVRRNFTKKYPNCAVCGKNKDIQVHHRKPFHLHPELELLESNLISLCSDHHLFVGHLMNYHSFNEKVEEDAKIWFNKIQTRP